MTVATYTKIRLEEELHDNGLSPLQNRALALLVESNMLLADIAKELGISRLALWQMRKDPTFQAAYRTQMAILESDAMRYAIASRVERIAALDRRWRQVNAELDKRRIPRADLLYAQIALQAEARKEIEGDVRRVEVSGRFEITEAIQVIRFEAQVPRADEPPAIESGPESDPDDDGVIEAEYHDTGFLQALRAAGARVDEGLASPEEKVAIRTAIAERGLDPCAVLNDEQFETLYGRSKVDPDPWRI